MGIQTTSSGASRGVIPCVTRKLHGKLQLVRRLYEVGLTQDDLDALAWFIKKDAYTQATPGQDCILGTMYMDGESYWWRGITHCGIAVPKQENSN
jgi:hypothetical protein